MKTTIEISNLAELNDFSVAFLKNIREKITNNGAGAVVVGLSGDLGAGKTAFSQFIASNLGVQDVVISPTFVIQKNYQTTDSFFKEFIHIDAYRIEHPNEMKILRFDSILQMNNTLIFIEWPEKITDILPKDIIMLSIESIDEKTRKISY